MVRLGSLVIMTLSLLFASKSAPNAEAQQIRVDAGLHTSLGSCPKCDFSGKNMGRTILQNAEFSGANFTRSNLSGSNFNGSNLESARFKRSFLIRAEAKSANMLRADFRDATLTEASFHNSVLVETDFRRADLSRAIFHSTDFDHANMTSASARGADFTGSKFNQTKVTHIDFEDAILNNGEFVDAQFGQSNLTGAKMIGTVLSGSDLSRTVGLTQIQLDAACGSSMTRLPVGLSVPYCDPANISEHHERLRHDTMSPDVQEAVTYLDDAILEVETLLKVRGKDDKALRRHLQDIHADLVTTRRAIEK